MHISYVAGEVLFFVVCMA